MRNKMKPVKSKKLVALLLSMTLVITAIPFCHDFSVEAADTLIGDLNTDNVVNGEDLSLCRDHIIGESTLSDEVLELADVNNDSSDIDVRDLVRYKRYLMEADTTWYEEAEADATEYHITNAAELYGLAEVIETEDASFAGKTVVLDNDITVNLGDETSWNADEELLKQWKSIGNWKGVFDGQEHTIQGIFQETEQAESGLFSRITDGATVKNVRLTNSYFKTTTSDSASIAAGSVIGNALTGSVENVYSDATIDVVSGENVTNTETSDATYPVTVQEKISFTTENTTANGNTLTDTDDGLQIFGGTGKYSIHTLETPISGANIDTITVRFKKVGTWNNALMQVYSGSQYFYVNLSSVSGDAVLSKTTDDIGFTTLVLDFQNYVGAANDTWGTDTRSTQNLTAIHIYSSRNVTGETATFDYVVLGKDYNYNSAGAGYGGVVGRSVGADIRECWYAGRVTSAQQYTGGIVGKAEADTDISDCMMTGTVISNMDAEQEKYIGGIAGYCTGALNGQSVSDCMMLGTVKVCWQDSDTAEVSGARATGSVIGRNDTIINFNNVYTSNRVSNDIAGGTINITNANVPGCGDLSADGTVSGAPMQRTLADIAQNVDKIIAEFGSDTWKKAANNTPVLYGFADLKDAKGADPSYLQARTDGGIYLSDFNDSSVLERTEDIGINPWDNFTGTEVADTSHDTITNANGTFTGIAVKSSVNATHSGFKYQLPDTFELKNATTLGLRFAGSYTNGYVPSFVYLTSGDTRVNVTQYSDIYIGASTTEGTKATSAIHLNGVKYQTICMSIDVTYLMNMTGLTTIDGIILGHNSISNTHVLDEFYYMPTCTPVSFNTTNTTGGTATKTDTDEGLQMSGTPTSSATYTFESPISGANIDTVTIRYKPTRDPYAKALMRLYSGSKFIYLNLDAISGDDLVSRVQDGDFEIVTFNFDTITGDYTGLWALEDRSSSDLTRIEIWCNNNNFPVVFDYVEFASAGDTGASVLPVYTALANPDEDGLELAAFTGPTDASVASYQKVKDCGIRTVYLNMWGNYALDNENTLTALNSCEEVGLDVVIMMNNTHNSGDPKSFLDNTTVDYTKYPAFQGVYTYDEPNISQLAWLKEDMDKWEESSYKDLLYLNNLMRWDTSSNKTVADTQEYLEEYWDQVLQYNDDNILMYDTYPFFTTRTTDDVDETNKSELTGTPYIRDFTLPVLETYAKFAKEKSSELYTFLQTYGAKYNATGEVVRNLKSVNDLRFQVAYNMAYGSKGFPCFTYESQSQFGDSMTYANGSLRNNYHYVKEVFTELKKWEHVYMAFDWQGTLTKKGTATGDGVQTGHLDLLTQSLTSHERISSIETEYDLLVGTFTDDNGNDGFLITSYTDPYYEISNTMKLAFNNTSKALVYKNGILQTNDSKQSCYVLKDGIMNMELVAGDYLFVVPLK